MQQRFISIWFRYLRTDWFTRRKPELTGVPFILSLPDHGKMIVTAVNAAAQMEGIFPGMAVADARAIVPALIVMDDQPALDEKLLTGIAEWCIRYTPVVAVDMPDGLLLNVTGCAHLWGGEKKYLTDIILRLKNFGYHSRGAIADTIGAAWAMARFGANGSVIESGGQTQVLLPLPPQALRIDAGITERLQKLGLRKINDFINMPRTALRRRFGSDLLKRIDQALGHEEEWIAPVCPIEPYQERLPCIEPIVTATGIEIALQRLLKTLCSRLQKEQKGLRSATFKGYRVDGKIEVINIGTTRASCNTQHLFKLFEIKIATIEPALGIELFTLDAAKVEDLNTQQESLWANTGGLEDVKLSELLDRIGGKIGHAIIHRYLPEEHYWPERSFKPATDLQQKAVAAWKTDKPRPVRLLSKPEAIEVTAPVPDYPPMMFRYKGKLHKIARADGPERIEQEWWLEEGRHRDYYYVEDEEGRRYWMFRLGHYDVEKTYEWFMHGFFA